MDTNQDKETIHFIEDLKRQWVATIDALVDPLILVNKDYSIQKANKAMSEISGIKVKDLIGTKCYKIFADRDSPCDGCQMQQALSKHHSFRYSLNQIRGKMDFEVTSQPIFDHNQPTGVVQVYRDRTEANILQRKLMQHEKLASIGLLAGGIAHEINNPLGGILIFSQMLLRELPKDSPFIEDVTEIENAAQRCKAIVERLLEFARAKDAKKKNMPIDITEAIKSALKFAKVHPNAKKVEFHEDWGDVEQTVDADRNSIIQVFLNIIHNALQAMPKGGDLFIRSYKKPVDGQLIGFFEVEDTGTGISKDNMKNIFDPFFTTKDPGEGTGLGLSICYSIVREFDGTIEVSSQMGQGTCFSVQFPLNT